MSDKQDVTHCGQSDVAPCSNTITLFSCQYQSQMFPRPDCQFQIRSPHVIVYDLHTPTVQATIIFSYANIRRTYGVCEYCSANITGGEVMKPTVATYWSIGFQLA